MSNPTMEAVVQRLDRVERENRRLKKAGVAILAGIAGVVLMGQAKPSTVAKVVEAEKFVLRDTAGKIRGELKVDGGSTFLILNDENERSRFQAFVYSKGGSLNLFGEGKSRATLRSSSGGSLNLHDSAGKDRVKLFVVFDNPYLFFKDKSGKHRFTVSFTGGMPHLALRDKDGKTISSLPDLRAPRRRR